MMNLLSDTYFKNTLGNYLELFVKKKEKKKELTGK